MAFNKFFIMAISLCASVLTASAAKPMKLPEVHNRIVEAQMQSNLSAMNSFERRSLAEVRNHTPFADVKIEGQGETMQTREDRLISYASRFIGTRYRLGATGPKAFDCSGFTGYVYRNFGINLSRTSREQFQQGQRVDIANLRPGDLLFFSSRSSGRQVGHVAMVVSVDPVNQTCKFIHASTKKGVVYQTFPDAGYYENRFMGARRILGTELDAPVASK